MQAANKGLKNTKKTWAFSQKYLDEAGNSKVPGDNSMESVVNKVLDYMWVASKGKFFKTPKKMQRCGKLSRKIEAELEGEDDADDKNDKNNKNDKSGENSDFKETEDDRFMDTPKSDWMFIGYVASVFFLHLETM